MATGVVIRGAARQSHQQCQPRQIQLLQWSVEIKVTGQTKTVHRPWSGLTQIDLIEVCLQNLVGRTRVDIIGTSQDPALDAELPDTDPVPVSPTDDTEPR